MTSIEQSPDPISDRDKEVLGENKDILSNNDQKIKDIFDSNFSGPPNVDKFELTGNSLSWLFQDHMESGDIENLINAIFNISINYNSEVKKELKSLDFDRDIIDVFEYIAVNHTPSLNRQANRATKGDDWWSNLTTTINYKDRTVLSHEFTVDMNEKVVVSNDIYGSHHLANHILQQTKTARNIIGEDVLDDVDKDLLEDIKDTIDDIIEEVDQYNNDKSGDEPFETDVMEGDE